MAVNRKSDFRGKEARKKPQSYSKLQMSTMRAGKSKASAAARKLQNAEVKHGTVRIGRGGKSYNVYDAKTGTWKRGVVKTRAPKPPAPPKPKSNIKDKKASRIGGYTPGTRSQTLPNTGWWSTGRYPGSYS